MWVQPWGVLPVLNSPRSVSLVGSPRWVQGFTARLTPKTIPHALPMRPRLPLERFLQQLLLDS